MLPRVGLDNLDAVRCQGPSDLDVPGGNTEQRVQLVPTAMRRAHNLHITARTAATADPVFLRFWDQGVKDRMPRAEQWWADNAARVDASLRR